MPDKKVDDIEDELVALNKKIDSLKEITDALLRNQVYINEVFKGLIQEPEEDDEPDDMYV